MHRNGVFDRIRKDQTEDGSRQVEGRGERRVETDRVAYPRTPREIERRIEARRGR